MILYHVQEKSINTRSTPPSGRSKVSKFSIVSTSSSGMGKSRGAFFLTCGSGKKWKRAQTTFKVSYVGIRRCGAICIVVSQVGISPDIETLYYTVA